MASRFHSGPPDDFNDPGADDALFFESLFEEAEREVRSVRQVRSSRSDAVAGKGEAGGAKLQAASLSRAQPCVGFCELGLRALFPVPHGGFRERLHGREPYEERFRPSRGKSLHAASGLSERAPLPDVGDGRRARGICSGL